MARRKAATTETETNTNEETETMTEEQHDQQETEGRDVDEQVLTFEEGDFNEELWPADKPICLYVTQARVGTVNNPESTVYGVGYISFEAVVQDQQIDPELEQFAGEATDIFILKNRRNRRTLNQLLMSLFGEIPRELRPDDLNGQPFVATFRHGKPKKDPDTGLTNTPMYLQSVRRDARG